MIPQILHLCPTSDPAKDPAKDLACLRQAVTIHTIILLFDYVDACLWEGEEKGKGM